MSRFTEAQYLRWYQFMANLPQPEPYSDTDSLPDIDEVG